MRGWGAYHRRGRSGSGHVAMAAMTALVIATLPAPAQSPLTSDAATSGPAGNPAASQDRAEELQREISQEIARMKADIATVKRFSQWQTRLMRIARTDPQEALRQRLPMAECRASFLAPVCDHLTGTFAPEEESSAAGNKPGPGETATTPDKGEGSQ